MVPGRKYTPKSIYRILMSGKWWLASGLIVGAIAAYYYVSRQPNVYLSQATILVRPQLVPQNYVRTTVTPDLNGRLRSLADRVFTPDRVASMLADIPVYPDLASDTVAITERLRTRTNVVVVRDDAFRIAFMHGDARIAADVAGRVAQAFVEENSQVRTGLAEGTDQFIDQQLTSTRERLAEHEHRLEEYRRLYAGQLPTQLSANLQAIQNAQVQSRSVAEGIARDREQRLKLEQTLASAHAEEERLASIAPVLDEPDLDKLTAQALQMRGREAARQLPAVRSMLQRLELQLKPEHPDIVRLKRVVAELERRAADDPGEGAVIAASSAAVAQRVDTLRRDIAELDARVLAREKEEKDLRTVIDRYQKRVELIPTRETELTTLMRDYDTLRESYTTLLTKKEEAQLASELERKQVGETMQVEAPARVPSMPFSPDRPRSVATGAIAGFLVVLLVIGVRESQDSALRTDAEVLAALAVNVVAHIPVIEGESDLRRGRLRVALVVSGVCVLIIGAAVLLYLRFGSRL